MWLLILFFLLIAIVLVPILVFAVWCLLELVWAALGELREKLLPTASEKRLRALRDRVNREVDRRLKLYPHKSYEELLEEVVQESHEQLLEELRARS
jgi:hypothetical protein